MAANKQSLLTTFKNYGLYTQQKGRPTAEAYLTKVGVAGDLAQAIRESFTDQGKLVGDDGKTPSLMDLMAMKNFI